MLNIPSRHPNFNEIYPTSRSFEAKNDFVNEFLEKSETASSESSALPSSWRSFNDNWLKERHPQIVPSAHGRIHKILFVVPRGFGHNQDNPNLNNMDFRIRKHFEALSNCLAQDDKKRECIVVCEAADEGIKKRFANLNPTYVLSPQFDITIWAQDAYVALEYVEIPKLPQCLLYEGVCFPRAEDMTIADDIAAQGLVDAGQSYLYFQGGNVLGGAKSTLIGYDYIWRNIGRRGLETQAKVIEAFEAIFGTAVIPLGGDKSGIPSKWDAVYESLYRRGILSGYGKQPIFHIDMYVTRTGAICEQTGKEIVMLGRPLAAKAATGKWSEVYEFDNCLYDSFFQETEDQLRAAQFTVKYLPLWLTYGDLNGHAPLPKYYNLSFNNVVIENYVAADGTKVKNVFMPTFSDSKDCPDFHTNRPIRQALEEAAQAAWKSIGFKVTKIEGLEDLAYGGGSIHCITKILKRGKHEEVNL